jgi:hypothetical protein
MITQVTMKAGVFTLTIIFWQLGIGAAAGGANVEGKRYSELSSPDWLDPFWLK